MLWEDETGNMDIISVEESDVSEYCPASSFLGVAGMVAEWLTTGERFSFQLVSRTVAFKLEVELGRSIWDSLEEEMWTSLSDEWERYCYDDQNNMVVFSDQ